MPKPYLSATVHALSHDGRGIASLDGKTTFIRGALPDEKVLFTYKSRKAAFDEAEVVEVLTPSALRQSPSCPHFGVCGGCALQHLSTEQQLALKQQTLLTQLRHFGHVEPEQLLPPLSHHPVGYRRRARLSVKFVDKKDKLLIGFHETNGRYTADLATCPILSHGLGDQLPLWRDLINQLDCYRHIAQLELAVGDRQIALIFRHLVPLSAKDRQILIHFAQQHTLEIYAQPNQPQPLEKLWPTDTPATLSYRLTAYDLELLFHPTDFTQVNATINEAMIQQALTLLDPQPHETMLDLFCGIGNFSLPLARSALRVIGVEGSVQMTQRAADNARHNGIDNAQFYPHDLTQPLTDCAWAKLPFDKILLDPPRTGALELVKNLCQLPKKHRANSIVYIACNPATLARDAGLFSQGGYRLVQAGIMDMFPHTQHVECIAYFKS